jgi:hypothetical protein
MFISTQEKKALGVMLGTVDLETGFNVAIVGNLAGRQSE